MPESNSEIEERDPKGELHLAIKPEYANIASITTTKWDVQISFGQRASSDEALPVASIVMSHLHAKEFSKVLSAAVEKLEEVIGEILDPEQKIVEYNQRLTDAQGSNTT